MKRVARRQKLAKREEIEFIDGAWPYIKVGTWAGVARVVGEAKRDAHPHGRVFVRGQVKNHFAMAPSLFRGVQQNAEALVAAEEEFARKLSERIEVARFKAENVGGLIQHYSFRTRWLDVLDNLFLAYWFAAHRISEGSDGSMRVCESGFAQGWLFLIRPPASASVVDLRAQHHPLSARPHVQHGVSLLSGSGGAPDFRDWVVATIQTPVSGTTAGSLFSGTALFPPKSSDHTLKLLLKHKANDLAAKIEVAHGVRQNALGRTSWWPDVT